MELLNDELDGFIEHNKVRKLTQYGKTSNQS